MLEALRSEPTVLLITVGIVGLAVGSFLNVIIHRLPRMMERDWLTEVAAEFEARHWATPEPVNAAIAAIGSLTLAHPRSACPACGHRIGALENVPILSYLWLRGKCSACRAAISVRYPLVELGTTVLSILVAWRFGPTLSCMAALLFCWLLMALAVIDFDTQLLPDALTLPLVWAGLLANALGAFTDLSSAVIGAAAGYLFLWAVYWLFRLATGREGMGYGDFKLLAAIGAFLGWQVLPLVILLSSVAGAILGILLMILARRGREVPMPFGPYLAIGALVALFAGKELTRAWLEFL